MELNGFSWEAKPPVRTSIPRDQMIAASVLPPICHHQIASSGKEIQISRILCTQNDLWLVRNKQYWIDNTSQHSASSTTEGEGITWKYFKFLQTYIIED